MIFENSAAEIESKPDSGRLAALRLPLTASLSLK
jgi:hypothetical protein